MKLIPYFELDNKVTFANFGESAVKVLYDQMFIQKTFDPFFKLFPGLKIHFENVSKIKMYDQWLDYASNLWIEKHFFAYVEEILKANKLEQKEAGTVCLVLLILKKIEEKIQRDSIPDKKTEMKNEFGKFINFILQYKNQSSMVKRIEFFKGKKVESFEHADFILSNILRIFEERFSDLGDWIEFRMEFPFHNNESESKKFDIDMTSKFRKLCLNTMNNLFSDSNIRESKKFFLINQLLGYKKILDYETIALAKNKSSDKKMRQKAIDKIKQQMKYTSKN